MNDILVDLKTESNIAFGKLYKDNFGKISKFVKNNGGNEDDAEDLFQEAMMILVNKLRQDEFRLFASINTYIYAICKNLWFKKLRNKNFQVSIDEIDKSDFRNSINESIEDEKSYLEKLKGYLSKITDHCNRLIHDIFFQEKEIEQIQKEYGYKSKHNAQNQKYKCVEQIRKIKEQEENIKK
ncbi:hypothetical protein GCM10007049_24590 [Echinicola pacifica]|uniref:RNA polymerase sigma-70 region 2 domain-containing protein n=1 Tax=Echinicola pacifica TaxID=346377 RepID=A0A918USS0_9BACT|nr:sigma-70 family RNA polymerase sigma factor [Echinicola pacifica]GGZ30775.1 hypothetical protein GCM10007049_24590 [Echinicola pacifica]